MKTFAVHPALADLIESLTLVDGGAAPYRVFPGPAPVMGLQLRGRIAVRDGSAWRPLAPVGITGLLSAARDFTSEAGTRTLLVRLTPWALPALFRDSARRLTDAHVALEGLASDAAELLERCAETTPTRAAHLLQTYLAHRAERAMPSDVIAREAARLILAHGGDLRMSALADRLGWTRRHVERRFLDGVGVSPKSFAELVRFQRARAMLDAGVPALDVAAACGFYDQSHLLNDLRRRG